MTRHCVHLLCPQKSKKDAKSAVLGILHSKSKLKSKCKTVSCYHDCLLVPAEGKYPECSTWHGKKEEKKEPEILYFSWLRKRKKSKFRKKKKSQKKARREQNKSAVPERIYLPYADIFPKKIHGNRGEIRGEKYRIQKAYVMQVFSDCYPTDIRIFKTKPTLRATVRELREKNLECHILPNPVKLSRDFWEEWRRARDAKDRTKVAKKYGILKDDSIFNLEKFVIDVDTDGTTETFEKAKKVVEESLAMFGITTYQLFRSRNGGIHVYVPLASTEIERKEIDWDRIKEEIAGKRIRGRLNRLLRRYPDEKIKKVREKGEKITIEGVKIAIFLKILSEYDAETAKNFYDFSKKFLIRSEKSKNIDISAIKMWEISTGRKGIHYIFTFSLPVAFRNLLDELVEIVENPPVKTITQEFFLSPSGKGRNGKIHLENLREVVAILSAYIQHRLEEGKLQAVVDPNFICRINHPIRLESHRIAKKNGTPVELYDLYGRAKEIQKEKSLYRFGSINLTERFWNEKWEKIENAGKIIIPEFVKEKIAEDIEKQELWKVAVRKLSQNHTESRWKKIILPATAWAISIGMEKEEVIRELSKILPTKKDIEKEIEKAWKYCMRQNSEFWEKFTFKIGDSEHRRFFRKKLWELSDEILCMVYENGGKISRQELVGKYGQKWLVDLVWRYLEEVGYVTTEWEIYGRGRPRKILVLTQEGIERHQKQTKKSDMVSLIREYVAIAQQSVAVGQMDVGNTIRHTARDFSQNINSERVQRSGLEVVGSLCGAGVDTDVDAYCLGGATHPFLCSLMRSPLLPFSCGFTFSLLSYVSYVSGERSKAPSSFVATLYLLSHRVPRLRCRMLKNLPDMLH